MIPIKQESVTSLLIKMYFNDIELSSGTAFLVESPSGPILLTNRHNVTGRHNVTDECLSRTGAIPNRIDIYHHQKDMLGATVTKSQNLYFDEDMQMSVWYEHPTFGPKVDFVALKLTDLEGVDIYTYSVGGSDDTDIRIGVTDIISVIGFPFGLSVGGPTAIWATGFVASEPGIDHDGLPLFLIDCRTRQGQSGSAVIAYRDGGPYMLNNGTMKVLGEPVRKFLGIYSGRINAQSDLGLVWKASAIKELIDSLQYVNN
ncbi:trypsin-like peptidase domain-containing protein [Priestia megaterium]|uniref:trypsin-like peptidase domain-containing protein n=1 Tax=Priestia megaterium TaxID=1404 RepID=UPI0010AC0A54|nr:trypsin-like peptidase domain-containing protein [Priestia megaterium]TJZ40384.1 trypsin-like peptidase domain-containing protein [Priestia megaterium]